MANEPGISSEEEALYNMSDEELDAAFAAAKAELQEPEPEVEPETEPEVVEDEPESTEELEVQEELETTEQPDAEKDSDDVVDEEKEEVEPEPEQSVETDETKTDDVEEKVETEPEVPSKYTIKANGNDFDLTVDELVKLAPKAMDYTKKMQEIAPWRKTISALKENNIEHADVNLMIDALKGNQDAITTILKKTGVDALSIDTEQETTYAPKEYGLTEKELDIQDIEGRISRDVEYGTTTHVVNNQWDAKSRETMFNDPVMIELLHNDIKSGVFKDVSPEAEKLKMLDGGRKSDVEYYIEAGHTYHANKNAEAKAEQDRLAKEAADAEAAKKAAEVARVKEEQAKQAKIKAEAEARKAAAPTKKSAGKTVIDYLDDNDEAYDEWYKKLQDSQ